jgi:23S rRNA-/tRNA-specific pseudouridylate synthase
VTASPQKFEKHIVIEDEGVLAVDVLADATELSKQCMKHAMKKGAVWVTPAANISADESKAMNTEAEGEKSVPLAVVEDIDAASEKTSTSKKTQRLRRAKKKLSVGDTLHLYYDEDILSELPAEPTLVADEGDYSIWYKPYGLRSQGSKWSDHCTIYRWVETHLEPQRSAFSVHRLDRAATGLMVIAHKKMTAVEFSRMFAKREIEKCYRVVVHGHFPETAESHTMNQDIDGRAAISHAVLLEYSAEKNCSLLEMHIESGRKHQIRRHLSEAGYPVVGDRLYGSAELDGEEDEMQDLQLSASYLQFHYPPISNSPWGERLDNEKTYELDDELVVKV